MKINRMGKLDLLVTEFCIGALPMGPLQANIPIDHGAHLIRKAWDNGVNFLILPKFIKPTHTFKKLWLIVQRPS